MKEKTYPLSWSSIFSNFLSAPVITVDIFSTLLLPFGTDRPTEHLLSLVTFQNRHGSSFPHDT
ncbi:hypothetical protein Hanom_Chr05g00467231 [Helianthus anomalus]